MAILNKQSQWQEPSVWQMPPLKTPRTTTCSLLRWWSAHWPKSLTYLILSAWMCVCGPALWLCARIKPMEQLCELSWVRALHVKLSPRQPPTPTHPPTLHPRPSSLLLSLHQDITVPGRVKLKVPFLPIFRSLPFIPYWRWALRSSPTSVCYFYVVISERFPLTLFFHNSTQWAFHGIRFEIKIWIMPKEIVLREQ